MTRSQFQVASLVSCQAFVAASLVSNDTGRFFFCLLMAIFWFVSYVLASRHDLKLTAPTKQVDNKP